MILALLTAALLLAGCGDKKKSASSSAGNAAHKRLTAALTNVAQIDTGRITIDGSIVGGGAPGTIGLKGGGPFDMKAKGGPAVDLALDIAFAGVPQKIGIVVSGGEAFLVFGARAFALGKSKGGSAGPVDVAGLKKALAGLAKYVSDVEQSGTTTVGGESVDLYSAKVDVSGLANAYGAKTKGVAAPALPGIPSVGDLKGSPPATIKFGIGADDLPRYIDIDAQLGQSEDGRINATVTLTDINDPVTIKPPKNPLRGDDTASALGGMFGAGQ